MKTCIDLLICGFASIIWTAQQATAAVVTLHAVQQSREYPTSWSVEQLGTTTVSAIGPGESGRTRYEVKEIQSRLVFHNPQQSITRTALDSPITMTYTYEEGASQIYQSSPPAQITGATPDQVLYHFGIVLNCNLDTSKAEGVCVEVDDVGSFRTGASPLTTTYTGSIMPWATVTTSSGLKTTGNSVVAVGIAVLGVLSGAVFILV